jgi:S1-C subfamily serine protease
MDANNAALAAQTRMTAALEAKLHALEAEVASQPDWTAIARSAEPSVLTIVTSSGLGSAWVARSGPAGSDLVTNFHVVADTWKAADVTVQVEQGDRTVSGTITRVDRANDLAMIHVADRLPALTTAAARPQLGETVMAVGSPLGLGGSVSIGVVSRLGSVDGSDYVQLSAPISPGNSGGPVLDRHGRVVAVAAAKFVGQGIEGVAFAIPVQTVCITVVVCQQA